MDIKRLLKGRNINIYHPKKWKAKMIINIKRFAVDPRKPPPSLSQSVCFFLFFFSAYLPCCHCPWGFEPIFFHSNCNNHLYGNSLRMLCCSRSREDNMWGGEWDCLSFSISFSVVFQPLVIHPYFKSITYSLENPQIASQMMWMLLFPANPALQR